MAGERVLLFLCVYFENHDKRFITESESFKFNFIQFHYFIGLQDFVMWKYFNEIYKIILSKKHYLLIPLLYHFNENGEYKKTDEIISVINDSDFKFSIKLLINTLIYKNEIPSFVLEMMEKENLVPQSGLYRADPFGDYSEDQEKPLIKIDKNKILFSIWNKTFQKKESISFSIFDELEILSIFLFSLKNKKYRILREILKLDIKGESQDLSFILLSEILLSHYQNNIYLLKKVFKALKTMLNKNQKIDADLLDVLYSKMIEGYNNKKIQFIDNHVKKKIVDEKINEKKGTLLMTKTEIDALLSAIGGSYDNRIDSDWIYEIKDLKQNDNNNTSFIENYLKKSNKKIEEELVIYLQKNIESFGEQGLILYSLLVEKVIMGYIEDYEWLIEFGKINIYYKSIFIPFYYLMQYVYFTKNKIVV